MDPVSLLGGALTVVTVGSLFGLALGKVVVPRVGRWKRPPLVLVHPSAPVELEDVHAAVQWWRDLGFEFGNVKITNAERYINGAILIKAGELGGDDAARATWDVETAGLDEDWHSTADEILGRVVRGQIWHAVIEVEPPPFGRDMRLLLVHELGHALGFQHCETAVLGRGKRGNPRLGLVGRKRGHVMHPLLSESGWNAKGLHP